MDTLAQLKYNKDFERIGKKKKKVRGIIGEEPPMFLHYGTTIISAALIIIGTILFITIIK